MRQERRLTALYAAEPSVLKTTRHGDTLCYALVLPGRKSAFRAGLAGLLPGRHRNRPFGRPKAGRRAEFGAFPVAVRPKSGPEGRFTGRKHYRVT